MSRTADVTGDFDTAARAAVAVAVAVAAAAAADPRAGTTADRRLHRARRARGGRSGVVHRRRPPDEVLWDAIMADEHRYRPEHDPYAALPELLDSVTAFRSHGVEGFIGTRREEP